MSATVVARSRPASRAVVALRIWGLFLVVHWGLRRRPLPDLVRHLAVPRERSSGWRPARLGRAIDRGLRIGPWRPRCLINALVMFRLASADGHHASLVIGLPPNAPDHEAHAWVEIGGVDVGPPPGRGSHLELARYP